MKTVQYTIPNNEGEHGTHGRIYADGTPVKFGDGRQGEEEYAPEIHSRKVGAACSVVGCASGRRLRGEIAKIESHTTGATTLTLAVGFRSATTA